MSSDGNRYRLEEAQAQLLLQALARGLEISWVAHGTSMLPSIPSGSSVTVTPLGPERLKRGEIGLFVLASRETHEVSHARGDDLKMSAPSDDQLIHHTEWILHRVLKIDPKRRLIHTRGDRLPHLDIPFTYLQCVGVLKRIDPPATYVQHAWCMPCSLSVWVNQRNARSVSARIIGLFWVLLSSLYHRFKYSRLHDRH